MLTKAQLASVAPSSSNFYEYLVEVMERYNINTPLRQAAFLAQVSHESDRFRFTVENLNYSAKGLLTTFPKYFTPAIADGYARNPERIANRVYAGRMGNGSEGTGDGWRYRGRGLIQLTGKNNYRYFEEASEMPCLSNPDILGEPAGACESAGWFWEAGGLNELADQVDMRLITKRINGGYNGLNARMALYEQYLALL